MDTRAQLLAAAVRRFSEKGFYGASIAEIAEDLGLTKQALLHHFGTKEKLYGEVLQGIADGLAATMRETMAEGGTPGERLERFLVLLVTDTGGDEGRLLMREILDNRQRAERTDRWYLKPLLEALTASLREVPGWRSAGEAETFAALYQLLGAVTYYAVSAPTLSRMLGKRAYQEVREAFPVRLRALVRATLENPPAAAR